VKKPVHIRLRQFLVVTLAGLLSMILIASCGKAPPQGVYVQEERADRTMTLKPDGRFAVQEQEGPPIEGVYRIEGQTLVLVAENGQESRGIIHDNILIDPQGNRWRKQARAR
jgi:hypothetical protein